MPMRPTHPDAIEHIKAQLRRIPGAEIRVLQGGSSNASRRADQGGRASTRHHHEPGLGELLAEPIMQALMHADRLNLCDILRAWKEAGRPHLDAAPKAAGRLEGQEGDG